MFCRLLLPLLLSLALPACTQDRSSTPQLQTASPRPVGLAQPRSVVTQRRVRAIGRLQASEQADLGFVSPGVIARIDVDIGDRLVAGQVLARLDSTALDATAAQARDQLAQARRDLERASGLIDRQLIARQQYDDARTRVDVAASALRAAAYGQRYGRIVAAAPGVVLARLAEPGEVVAAGQPVLRVSAGRRDWLLPVEMADRDGALIRVGDTAEVEIDVVPGRRFAGRVERVGGEASAMSGAIPVELRLEMPATLEAEVEARLRSGLVARAHLELREGDALQIPVAALVEADFGRGVLLVAEADQDGVLRARRREVRLGGILKAEQDRIGHVQVLEGLPAEARVIVAGAAFVQEGDAVRAVDAAVVKIPVAAPAAAPAAAR